MELKLNKAAFYYGASCYPINDNGVFDLPKTIDPESVPLDEIYEIVSKRATTVNLPRPQYHHTLEMPEFGVPEMVYIWGDGYDVTYKAEQ